MKTKTALLAMALLIAIGAARPIDAADEYHFGLAKSAPEADASVPSLEEVRLWFTEPPEDNSIGHPAYTRNLQAGYIGFETVPGPSAATPIDNDTSRQTIERERWYRGEDDERWIIRVRLPS